MKSSNLLQRCGVVALGLAGAILSGQPSVGAEESAAQRMPPPTLDAVAAIGPQTAVFSGGCFWGVQGVFQHVSGVTNAVSGYAGGAADTAQYPIVHTGRTGHAETVRITFDPTKISYGQLLQIFFSVVLDPTEIDRQGPDSGSEYRSEIFAANPEQARIAHEYIAQLEQAHVFAAPIATRVDALPPFYPAEARHQNYLEEHRNAPYIAQYDLPKLADLERLFPAAWVAVPRLAHVRL